MQTELYISLSPEGLTVVRQTKIAEWVKNLKKSLGERTVERLTIKIASEEEVHDVKK